MHYLFYKVNKADIVQIKFLLEGYDGLCEISTVDRTLPKIQITVAPDFLPDVNAIIADLKKEFYMEKIEQDPKVSEGNY